MEEDIHQDWLNWVNSSHIDDVLNTGYFVSKRILRVIDSPNEGVTYCIQFIADSLDDYNRYIKEYSNQHQADIPEQFQNKLVTFQTAMEFIDTE